MISLLEKLNKIIEWFDKYEIQDTTTVLGPIDIGIDLKELREIAEDLYRLEDLCR